MCVILVCDKARPTYDLLTQCENDNPHGGGIAWRSGGQIQFAKGLDAKEILSISNKVELPFVIHFRIATAGGMSPEMCHPFPIGGSVKMQGKAPGVLFHNGHWTDWEDVFLHAVVAGNGRRIPTGDISDTRALAIMVGWYGQNLLKLIKHQKFVFFDHNTLETYGYWQDSKEYPGIAFSNLNWYNYKHYHGYTSHGANTYREWDHVTKQYKDVPISTAITPYKPAEESAKVFRSAADNDAAAITKAANYLGVTEEDIENLEHEHGITVDNRGNLVSLTSGEVIEEIEMAEVLEEEMERVTVATFGEHKTPIKVGNS